jgi:hypothetical protein
MKREFSRAHIFGTVREVKSPFRWSNALGLSAVLAVKETGNNLPARGGARYSPRLRRIPERGGGASRR